MRWLERGLCGGSGTVTEFMVAAICSGLEGSIIQAYVDWSEDTERVSWILISAYRPGSEKVRRR